MYFIPARDIYILCNTRGLDSANELIITINSANFEMRWQINSNERILTEQKDHYKTLARRLHLNEGKFGWFFPNISETKKAIKFTF